MDGAYVARQFHGVFFSNFALAEFAASLTVKSASRWTASGRPCASAALAAARNSSS